MPSCCLMMVHISLDGCRQARPSPSVLGLSARSAPEKSSFGQVVATCSPSCPRACAGLPATDEAIGAVNWSGS